MKQTGTMHDIGGAGRLLTVLFYTMELLLYLSFLTLDLTHQSTGLSNVLKYSSILCCAVAALLRCLLHRAQNGSGFLAAALLFTAASDYFLLFSDCYTPGLYTFCLAQTAYLFLLRLSLRQTGFWLLRQLIIRLLGCVLLLPLLSRLTGESLLFLIPLALYAVSFAANIALSSRASVRLFAGLILFALCDINVLLFHLSDYLVLPASLTAFFHSYSWFCMWLFYLPSQVLLTLCPLPRSIPQPVAQPISLHSNTDSTS